MRWLIALALAMLATQSPAGKDTGDIIGRVTDSAGGLIPGATITLRWSDGERTTVTDAKGTFSFADVAPGRYAVIASLVGFQGRPHTDVAVTAARTITLTLVLNTGCLGIIDYVDMGLAWVRNEADVIARVQIGTAAPPPACAVSSHCSCTLHLASVLHVVKGKAPARLRLLQEGAGYLGQEEPYAPGDEFIAFLKRDDRNHAYARVGGPDYMFHLRDGRLDFAGRTPPAGLRNGMTVAEFEKALRALR